MSKISYYIVIRREKLTRPMRVPSLLVSAIGTFRTSHLHRRMSATPIGSIVPGVGFAGA
jgi:hypothetical protein